MTYSSTFPPLCFLIRSFEMYQRVINFQIEMSRHNANQAIPNLVVKLQLPLYCCTYNFVITQLHNSQHPALQATQIILKY